MSTIRTEAIETKYHISFSGGIGSAISALLAYEYGLDFTLLFADTLIEDEDLYRFCDDIERVTETKIVRLVDGRTPWDVYVDKRWIGNTKTAHCSTELKTVPVRKWLDENALPNEPLVLGMDWSEMDRIERAGGNWSPRPVVSLLNEFRVLRPEYDGILKRFGIKKPRLYGQGYSHNNCGGFCCKAGLGQLKRLHETNPKRYRYHEEQMELAMAKIGPTAKPFLRKTDFGLTYYLTLKEYRLMLEAEQEGEIEDGAEGCGCFTDD